MLDQTLLPGVVRYIDAHTHADVADAIRRLAVRGAPLIGIAAAYGLTLAARRGEDTRRAADELLATRPTAVNLRWAVDRVLAAGAEAAESEARDIHDEQRQADLQMGELGAELIADGMTVLTHCNTGSLATGGIGTALGVIKTAYRQGKRIRVLVDETRPLLQGARLTSWELAHERIPHEIIVDAAAPALIASGEVSAIFVGADRIAQNGDTANKIGTYMLGLAAQAHDVPFYVVAPASTIDVNVADGSSIAIEEREAGEILAFAGRQTAPASSVARNPAFDVTPAGLITAIITARGVLRAPYHTSIARIVQQPAVVR
jgi:methylthioribose-1-phosphate isomerase